MASRFIKVTPHCLLATGKFTTYIRVIFERLLLVDKGIVYVSYRKYYLRSMTFLSQLTSLPFLW
jgi:hypothetical protein